MAKILIWNDKSGNMIYTVPGTGKTPEEAAAKCLPSGTSYSIIEHTALPTEKGYRTAWEKNGDKVVINVDKAREIAHQTRREKRAAEFKPNDDIIALNIPGTDIKAAEDARSQTRWKYKVMQDNLDRSKTISELNAVLEDS